LAAYKAAPSKAQRAQLEQALQGAVQQACAKVYRACFVEKSRKPSSAALGAVLVLEDYAISVHVGNTRLYLVRGGKTLRLTLDHTYYEEMLRQMPKGSPLNPAFKKRLTRAIGDSESVPLAVTSVPLMPDDLLILCSNGLSDCLSADASEVGALCKAGAPATLHTRLVEFALSRKSDDNITAVVAQITADPQTASAPTPIERDPRKQLEVLRGLKIFHGIRGDERALLKMLGLLTFRHAKAGDIIVQQGSPSDELFVLLQGKSEVRAGDKVIAHRGPGDVIGEMGFFDGRLRSATIVATQATELMSIQRWEFDALVEQDWRLGYRILEAVVVAMAGKIEEKLTEPRV
jgi:protein phosphatase